jgi:hypothetical protein
MFAKFGFSGRWSVELPIDVNCLFDFGNKPRSLGRGPGQYSRDLVSCRLRDGLSCDPSGAHHEAPRMGTTEAAPSGLGAAQYLPHASMTPRRRCKRSDLL